MSKNKRFKDKKYSSKCLSIELHQKTFYGYFGQFVGLQNTPHVGEYSFKVTHHSGRPASSYHIYLQESCK